MQTIDRDQIIQNNSLVGYLEDRGIKLRRSGSLLLAHICPTTQHKPDHWCVSIEPGKELFHCNDCGHGGSIIDWIALAEGKSIKDVLIALSGQPQPAMPPQEKVVVATYDYVNENNDLLYQVVRYHPKDFRQRQPTKDGGWKWTMDGATRVLYNLPEVLNAKKVTISEGEKDADTLKKLGYVGTCNVGGAGKWLDAYGGFLKGKDILIFPDNDKVGKEHAEQLVKSLSPLVLSIKRIVVPSPYKDITQWVESLPDLENAKLAVGALIESTAFALKPVPIYNIEEMEAEYIKLRKVQDKRMLSLNRFLPTLGKSVRKIVPGELILIMADTGVGKTMLMQQMARAAEPLPTLFFELELPLSLMFERFVQMDQDSYADEVDKEYDNNLPRWKIYRGLRHIQVCPESGISAERLEEYVVKSELRFGEPAAVVLVDYMGLMRGGVGSRYERISENAEQLKVVAKRTNTIIVMGSQISREAGNRSTLELFLHDAKDSGSLENSAGLVLGAWRPEADTLMVKILKNTKGSSGKIVPCNFDGARMQLTEKIEPLFPETTLGLGI